ncbi:MAG: guanylate cyclase [Rhodospirillales bacterium RIFCSPLOWO2_12_FULL_58_28]|nr:MAG: guanylate cyclase [Rhodospirillales bacterium RIFCSPLOWO2_02_FULL_58_16]OHC77940.1 MAG: guanylate cyclase [Rhodospirillales bacterium RIFCSPLOWO2_12_FULL_58_28]
MLLDVSRQVAGIETVDEVLATLVDITTKETNSERGTIFLNNEQSGELYSRFAQGEIRREIRIMNTSGIAGHVFTTGLGLIVNDAYSDERFNRSVDQQTGFETRQVLCAPIRTAKGDIIGVAQALNKKEGKYTEDDLALLEAMTTQAAVALQSTQYVEKMRKSRETELEFLDIVSDVTSEIDLSALLQRVMGEATRMLKADRSTLFLNDNKTGELWSQVGDGLTAIQIRLPNTAGIAGAVYTSGKSVNIPYAYADLRFNPAFDKKTGYFTRSILCVPVVNKKGQTIGVTQVLNKRGGPFTDEDESRLKAFTSQVSIALENAKLFDDVQNMKKYAESMLESMSNGVVTLDDEGKIATCNAAGQRILKVKDAEIIGVQAEAFFAGPNEWVMEKIKQVNVSHEASIWMDATLMVGMDDEETGEEKEKISVNLTILPLVNAEKKMLGALLMIEDISTEKRMKSTMSRYMDPAIAEQLLGKGKGEDVLGGAVSEVSVLFSDVRSFTTLTEQLGAQGTVALLNEYFTIMVDCITNEGGMLDKFIGDAIMCAFGLPIPHADDEDRSVRAGISMLTSLDEWNATRQAKGLPPVLMGLGINTDKVVSGNIGSPKRMDYTLIGDGVNLAARLESACKQYSAKMLISEHTFRKLKGTYRIRYIDDVVVKGKTEPVGVHEVLDYHTDKTFPNLMDVVNYFNEGRKQYRAGNWQKAVHCFKECLKGNPEDALSETYIERCEHLEANPPEDWKGVWVMTGK